MELLLNSRSQITRIPTGKTAISYAQREMFDAAIIVSTGDEMDVAETIFNLTDINSAMQIILVSDRIKKSEPEIQTHSLERVVPNTKVMTLQELRIYFDSKQKEASR
jgi:DNA-binding response OmpR family regulator